MEQKLMAATSSCWDDVRDAHPPHIWLHSWSEADSFQVSRDTRSPAAGSLGPRFTGRLGPALLSHSARAAPKRLTRYGLEI
eukprot:760234-Hanusia_phi.AAC.10